MNREILFRGKSANTGEWVEGFCVQFGETYSNIIIREIGKLNLYGVVPIYEHEIVISETVGQYTGLKDKNGRKIFEGDIIKCSDTINDIEFNAVVEFGNPNHDYSWGYQLKHISGEKPNLDILCWVDMEETGAFIEVIGNIHDNPELVRKDEENESSYKSD